MKHALAGIIGDRQRQIIHAVVDEIFSKPGEEYVMKLMPMRMMPSAILINEKLSGMGGLTGERALNERGKAINAGSSKTAYFDPGSYQEHVLFTERDLLRLRRYGSIGERGLTGVTAGELDELSRSAMKLQLRMKNRMNKLNWDALFTGLYNWKNISFNFGIPGGNALTAASDWTNYATSTPLADLWALQTTNAKLIKYKIKEFVMNPKTAADMMSSASINKVLQNMNVKNNDINELAKFLYPNLAPIKIVADHWQDESLVSGEIVLGDASYFVPNDKILVVPDFGGTLYGAFGEFDVTENLNDPSATIEKPAIGPYTFVDEKGLEERESPWVKVVSGFNGAPNLLRANDVFTIATH